MNLGITEMIFLFVLGLLLFGPKKLPGIGRQLGRALAEFKRASNEFQSQLHEEVRKLEEEEDESNDKAIAPVSPPGTAPRGDLPSYVLAPEENQGASTQEQGELLSSESTQKRPNA